MSVASSYHLSVKRLTPLTPGEYHRLSHTYIATPQLTPQMIGRRAGRLLMLALHVAHARCVTIVPPAVVQLGLAGLAGALGAICVYPIDLVKTRLQSTVGGTSYGNAFEVVDEMMTNEGGLPALFKGIRPQLVGVVPEKTIKLFVHDAAVLACGEAASGFLAGGCQVVVTNPLEVVKVRMQLSPDGGLRVSDVVSELGLRGLYTGVARPRLALNLRPGPRLSSSP